MAKTAEDWEREDRERKADEQKRRDEEAQADAMRSAGGFLSSIWNNLGTIIIGLIAVAVLFGTDMGKTILDGAKDMLGGFVKMLPESWQQKIGEWMGAAGVDIDISSTLEKMSLDEARTQFGAKGISAEAFDKLFPTEKDFKTVIADVKAANGDKIGFDDFTSPETLGMLAKKYPERLGAFAKAAVKPGADGKPNPLLAQLTPSLKVIVEGPVLDELLTPTNGARTVRMLSDLTEAMGKRQEVATLAPLIAAGLDPKTGKPTQTLRDALTGMLEGNAAGAVGLTAAAASQGTLKGSQLILAIDANTVGTDAQGKQDPELKKLILGMQKAVKENPVAKLAIDNAMASLTPQASQQFLAGIMAGTPEGQGAAIRALIQPDTVKSLPHFVAFAGAVPELRAQVETVIKMDTLRQFTTPQKLQALGNIAKNGVDVLTLLPGFVGTNPKTGKVEVSSEVTLDTLKIVHALVGMAKGDVSPKAAFTGINAKALSGFFSRGGNHTALLNLLNGIDAKVLPVAQQHLITAITANMGDQKTHGISNLLADERGAQLFLDQLPDNKPGTGQYKTTVGLSGWDSFKLAMGGIDYDFASLGSMSIGMGGHQNVFGRNADTIKSLAKAFDVAQCESIVAPARTPQRPAATAAKH